MLEGPDDRKRSFAGRTIVISIEQPAVSQRRAAFHCIRPPGIVVRNSSLQHMVGLPGAERPIDIVAIRTAGNLFAMLRLAFRCPGGAKILHLKLDTFNIELHGAAAREDQRHVTAGRFTLFKAYS